MTHLTVCDIILSIASEHRPCKGSRISPTLVALGRTWILFESKKLEARKCSATKRVAGEHRFWAEGVNANGKTVKSEVVMITVVK